MSAYIIENIVLKFPAYTMLPLLTDQPITIKDIKRTCIPPCSNHFLLLANGVNQHYITKSETENKSTTHTDVHPKAKCPVIQHAELAHMNLLHFCIYLFFLEEITNHEF